jgi:hypothetical protein
MRNSHETQAKANNHLQFNAVLDLDAKDDIYSAVWSGPPTPKYAAHDQSIALTALVNGFQTVPSTNSSTTANGNTSAGNLSGGSSKASGGAIAGAVIGSLASTAAIVGGYFLWRRRRQQKDYGDRVSRGTGRPFSQFLDTETGRNQSYYGSSQYDGRSEQSHVSYGPGGFAFGSSSISEASVQQTRQMDNGMVHMFASSSSGSTAVEELPPAYVDGRPSADRQRLNEKM